MSVERDRLLSLIEFSQQSARLRGKPAATVAAHGLFALYEHEIQGLPGIRINVNDPENEDEIWLAVERLHETRPPDVASAVLRPWIQMTQGPTEEPRLREAPSVSSLDETRRLGTVALLADLSPRLNQLCVFTHKKDFLRMLFDGIHDKGVLQLKSDKKNGSRIAPFDVEDDRKAEIARLCDDMSRYLNEDFGPTPEDMQGNIRKVSEIILKTKYYRALTAEIKAKSGLGEIIGVLHGKDLINDALKDQLFRLGRLSDLAHHGDLTKSPEHVLTREEICAAIQETFGVVEKL